MNKHSRLFKLNEGLIVLFYTSPIIRRLDYLKAPNSFRKQIITLPLGTASATPTIGTKPRASGCLWLAQSCLSYFQHIIVREQDIVCLLYAEILADSRVLELALLTCLGYIMAEFISIPNNSR